MTSEAAIWSWRKSLPSTTGHAQRAIDCVLERLLREGWTTRDLFGIHLALEEALVNAVKHGNRGDRSKQVQVECELYPTCVKLQIYDEGPGFNAAEVVDPCADENLERSGGRGLLLMRGFMTRVEYLGCGNRVVLEKVRTSVAAVA